MKQTLRKGNLIPFTQVPNVVLNDSEISFKAKGIYCYMFSKPDGWDFSADRIAMETRDGIDAIQSGLRELREVGLLHYQKKNDGRVEYTIYSQRTPDVIETVEPAPAVSANNILTEQEVFAPTATNEKEIPNQQATIICRFFDNERRKIQPNFTRNEMGAEYKLVQEFRNTPRTYEMYIDAIKWLYSGEKEALFWRDAVNTIAGLIKNLNAIEMKYISKSKEGKDSASTQRAFNYYRKQGMSDAEIEEGLQNGTL